MKTISYVGFTQSPWPEIENEPSQLAERTPRDVTRRSRGRGKEVGVCVLMIAPAPATATATAAPYT